MSYFNRINMKKLLKLIIPIAFLALIYLSSCEYAYIVEEEIEPPDTTVDMSFNNTIKPIFDNRNCTNCHKPNNTAPDLTPDNAYGEIVPDYVDLDNPEMSIIYTKPLPDGDHFQKYTAKQAQDLLLWIQQGAKDN